MFNIGINKNNFFNFIKTQIKWKYIILIFAFQILPTIYKTTRIFFLGNIPDEGIYNIASQILWLNILYEIIIESIVIPMFFILNYVKHRSNYKNNITLISTIVFGIFIIFTIIIFFNIKNILINLIDTSNHIFNQSFEYIRFEVWGMMINCLLSYLFLVLMIIKKKHYMIIGWLICVLYTLLSCLFDLFFISNYNFSLKLSVKGMAINSIITNFICSLILIIYFALPKTRIWNFNFSRLSIDKHVIKKYFKSMFIAAIEICVRNIMFYFMIIKPINELNESGLYWISDSFIWSWLLLPITTLQISIKRSFVYSDLKSFKYQICFYIIFTTIAILIWLVCIPLNPFFIKNVMNIHYDYKYVAHIVLILMPFYILLSYASIIDSIFINQGKINLYCIQSLFVNLTVYPIYYILWKTGIWKPTLESICIMFGTGMIVHLLINIFLFWLFIKMKTKITYKRRNLKTNKNLK